MEPWDGPACVVVHRRHQIGAVLDRNGLRPGRYWVTEDGLVVLASEAGVLDLDPKTIVAQGPAEPGQMFLARPRRAPASSTTTRSRPTLARRAPVRRVAATPAWSASPTCPTASTSSHTHALGHPSPAGLRLHRGGAAHPARADGPHRRRADRLDGHRHPDRRAVGPPAAALRLLQPAVRPGHQPAAGRDPRGARHLARRHDRPRGQPARRRRPASCRSCSCRSRSSTTTSWPRSGTSTATATCRASRTHVVRGLYDVARRRRRARGAARRDLRRGLRGDRRRRAHHRAVRPALRRRPGADPVAAADRRRAPPPGPREDPHPGRAARRGRRRPRGAPRRAAHRLRRRRRSTRTSRMESAEDLARERGLRRRRRAREGGAQPGQGARQGRAQGDEQDGRLDGRLVHAARRSSRRSACRRSSSTATSPARPRELGGVGLDVLAEEVRRAARARRTRRPASPPSHRQLEVGGEYQWRREGERTCSTPRRSSACSTPPARAATTSSSSTRSASTTSPSG